jgi:hypothetical protein
MDTPMTEKEFMKNQILLQHKHRLDDLPEDQQQAVLAELYITNGVDLTPEEKELHRQYPLEIKEVLGRYTFDDENPVQLPSRAQLIKMGPRNWRDKYFFENLAKNASGKTYKNDDYFLKLTRGIIRNDIYRKIFAARGRSVVYEYLWANIIRNGWNDKPGYPLKARYYDKGFLVHSSSYSKVAEKCFLDRKTVSVILRDEFHKLNIIRLVFLESKGHRNGQFVAILGTWEMAHNHKKGKDAPVETYFRDDVFYLNNSGLKGVH